MRRSVVKIWRSQWKIMYNVNFQDLCIKTSWIHTSYEIAKACSFSPSHINQSSPSIMNIAGSCSKTDSFTSPYLTHFLVANILYFKCGYAPASDTKLSSPMSRRLSSKKRRIKQTSQYFTIIVCPGFLDYNLSVLNTSCFKQAPQHSEENKLFQNFMQNREYMYNFFFPVYTKN